jgi:RNase P subunit RPR2
MNNVVIAGDFENGLVWYEHNRLTICKNKETILVNAKTVKSYELVTEESKKSTSSAVVRGLVGGALLGGVGAVAGAVSGKEKGTYEVAIEFMDGKKCLVKLDDKMYKTLVKECFNCGSYSMDDLKNEIETFQKENEKNKGKAKKGAIGCLIVFVLIVLFFVWLANLIK